MDKSKRVVCYICYCTCIKKSVDIRIFFCSKILADNKIKNKLKLKTMISANINNVLHKEK